MKQARAAIMKMNSALKLRRRLMQPEEVTVKLAKGGRQGAAAAFRLGLPVG